MTMTRTLTRSDVYEKTAEVIVDRLGVEPDEINRSSALVRDLGAESIDVLDLLFCWEKEFRVELPDSAIDEIMGFSPIHERHRMRFTDFSAQEQAQIASLLTVGKVADYIFQKLEGSVVT